MRAARRFKVPGGPVRVSRTFFNSAAVRCTSRVKASVACRSRSICPRPGCEPDDLSFPIKVSAGGQVRVHFDGARYVVVGGTPTGNATALGRTQLISSSGGILPA